MTTFITLHTVSTAIVVGRERELARDFLVATSRVIGAMTFYPTNRAGDVEVNSPSGAAVQVDGEDAPILVAESPSEILALIEAAEQSAAVTMERLADRVHFDI